MKKRRDIIRNHVLTLAKEGDYGLCAPPMDAQTAVYELCRYFLGDDWYTAMSEPAKQVNTEIVYEIEMLYRGDRKAWKKLVEEAKHH